MEETTYRNGWRMCTGRLPEDKRHLRMDHALFAPPTPCITAQHSWRMMPRMSEQAMLAIEGPDVSPEDLAIRIKDAASWQSRMWCMPLRFPPADSKRQWAENFRALCEKVGEKIFTPLWNFMIHWYTPFYMRNELRFLLNIPMEDWIVANLRHTEQRKALCFLTELCVPIGPAQLVHANEYFGLLDVQVKMVIELLEKKYLEKKEYEEGLIETYSLPLLVAKGKLMSVMLHRFIQYKILVYGNSLLQQKVMDFF